MEIKIAKFKVRRGTNSQRKTAIFDQGEFVYTLDTKRLYIGNGVLSGGEVVGNKNFTPLTNFGDLSTLDAEVGDYATLNSIFYQLTATPSTDITNWATLSSNPLNFIGLSSLSASLINPTTVSNGLKIQNNILQTNINTKSFEISAFQLSLKPSGVDEREISSTSFGNGISGGSNQKISLNIDTNYFNFNGNRLTLNSSLSTGIAGVDNNTIVNVGGIISQTPVIPDSSSELPAITVDQYGRVVSLDNSIYDTLTGFDSVNTTFNGTPAHSLSGGIGGLNLTVLSALSTNNVTTVVIELSSAGFLTFAGNTESRTGQPIGRYAIPIFTY